MKFWDTSALVPLIVDEPRTKAVRDLLAEDADVMIWTLTSVELMSALGRLARLSDGLQDLLPAMRESAALTASGDRPERLEIITLDSVLARSARLEGFRVTTPAGS